MAATTSRATAADDGAVDDHDEWSDYSDSRRRD